MNRKLRNIQWQMIRFSVWLVFFSLSAFFGVLAFWSDVEMHRWLPSLKRPQSAVFWSMLLLIPLIGFPFGYIYGNILKKRLKRLVESILKFENGNYSHRVPFLGDDEIGLVARHLNRMATRFERQVASLQKMATIKTEYEEKLKKAAVAEERQRLARELHDAVSQQLFAISMTSAAAKRNAREEKTIRQMKLIEKMAGDAQNEMRALLLHLRPVTLEEKGLKEGLEVLVKEFQNKQPVQLQLEMDEMPRLARGVEDHLFRIVQEGMANMFRHARATRTTIQLKASEQKLTLRIQDNGVGFDVHNVGPSSYGLRSIRERANEIGGVAEIFSKVGKGTEIRVQVPIVKEGEERID